jgi:plastocyanin domain-containing protein
MAGIIVIVLGVFNFQNGLSLIQLGPVKRADVAVNVPDKGTEDVQIVRIIQKGNGYFPDQVMVKRGQKVRLIVDSEESYSCAASLVIPAEGIRKTLKPGENMFEFTPDTSGDIPFSCSMGMYRGVIHVTE